MSEQIKNLKQDAKQAAETLSENVKRFEIGLKQQVNSTKKVAEDLFSNGIPSPKAVAAVVRYQVREHPLATIGAVTLFGFASSYWFTKTWKPAITFLVKEIDPDFKHLRSAALMLATSVATNQVKDKYPVLVDKLTGMLSEKIQA